MGFRRLKTDSSLFIKNNGNNRIVVVIYINDAIFCSSNKDKVLRVKQIFMDKWESQDLGDLKEFLWMKIQKVGNKMVID